MIFESLHMNHLKAIASVAALLSALFYGISVPLVKLFGEHTGATWTSSLLYFGAGLCMIALAASMRCCGKRSALGGQKLTKKQAPLLVLMVALNAASAIALMAGISLSDASTASLLGNFEVAATAVLAWIIFRERMGKLMVAAIAAITLSGLVLSWDGSEASFSAGALLILLACAFWGLENNCTRALSEYDVVSVTRVKGIFAGIVSALIALATGDAIDLQSSIWLLLVGAVSYGASIALYIWAQRYIGAARTGNYYSIAPFVGVVLSWAMFGAELHLSFLLGLALSIVGVALTALDVSKGETSR